MKQQLETRSMGEFIRQIYPGSTFSVNNRIELAENILLFLLSRIVFLDYLISPFGVALFSSLFYRRKRISYVISALLGVASTGSPLFFFKYAGSVLIVCVVQFIFKKELEHKKRMIALLGTGAVFVNGGIYVIFEGFFTFDALLLILECALFFGTFFVFDKSAVLLRQHKKAYGFSDIITVASLLGTGILSLGLSENFEPLAHVASIFLILFCALSCGAAPCAPVGAIFGLALGAGTTFPAQLICIYTLSSLSCGLLYRQGRLAAAGGFGATSVLSTLILCPEANGILTVSYVGAACLLLLFVPDSLLTKLSSLSRKPRREAAQFTKINDAMSGKFAEIINSTQSVSNIFHEVIDSLTDPSYESTTAVFDTTSDKVCSDCSLYRFCWQKDRQKTLSAVERMCSSMENKTGFSNKDIPTEFSQICIRSEAFASELAKNLESFRVSKMWSGKLLESKRLVAEQFKNISMILEDTKKSVTEKIAFLPEAEQRIRSELDKLGIYTDNICVYAGDGYYVEISLASCEEKTQCDTLVPSVLSEILEVPIVKVTSQCAEGQCTVAFCEKPPLITDVATASAVKKYSAGSGDSLCCFSPDTGKIAIVLCDGMGSGEHANYQSNIATELCKKLMTAGFNKETCVRLINDILITGADRESFSTMDICIVNLYTAQVEFIKAGAPISYIGQNNSLKPVEGSSLPVGMLAGIEPDIHSTKATAGDFIIMATDGITDALAVSDNNEIQELCKDFEGTARELADKILDRALSLSKNHPTDDMTVTVCRLCAK